MAKKEGAVSDQGRSRRGGEEGEARHSGLSVLHRVSRSSHRRRAGPISGLKRLLPAAVLVMSPGVAAGCTEQQAPKGRSASAKTYVQGQLQQFNRWDDNRDGVIDYVDLPKKIAKRYKRMDGDTDGRLTRAELEKGAAQAFARADKNKDGVLDLSEQH